MGSRHFPYTRFFPCGREGTCSFTFLFSSIPLTCFPLPCPPGLRLHHRLMSQASELSMSARCNVRGQSAAGKHIVLLGHLHSCPQEHLAQLDLQEASDSTLPQAPVPIPYSGRLGRAHTSLAAQHSSTKGTHTRPMSGVTVDFVNTMDMDPNRSIDYMLRDMAIFHLPPTLPLLRLSLSLSSECFMRTPSILLPSLQSERYVC